jgi:hypothetical protein
MSELTIQDVEKAIDKGFEKQAIFINRAFEAQANHFEGRLDKKIDDLRDDLKKPSLRRALVFFVIVQQAPDGVLGPRP